MPFQPWASLILHLFFLSFNFEDLEELVDFDLVEVIGDSLGTSSKDCKLFFKELRYFQLPLHIEGNCHKSYCNTVQHAQIPEQASS